MSIRTLGCELPNSLYQAEQVRQLDALAIQKTDGGGYTLMRSAGQAAFAILCQQFPQCRQMSVVCGGGNNGGDGYVVAELALQAGFQVELLAVTDPARLSGEASQAYEKAKAAGVLVQPWSKNTTLVGEVIVDALLGTGLAGEVRADYAEVINRINQARLPVVAIDIPSGLAADTGMPLGPTVQAAVTITFIGIKQGLLTGAAADYVGELWFDDLHVPPDIYAHVPCQAERINLSSLQTLLPKRKKSAHKGNFGHVLVIGGDSGFGGAAILASEAALFAGAGLVSCATRECNVTAGLARQPDIMYRSVEQRSTLLKMIAKADVLVVGPGLGADPWGQMCLQAALASARPLVIDADGLNQLAISSRAKGRSVNLPAQSVITPHPGEASRLLGWELADINKDRFAAVSQLAKIYACTALLKGFGTLISVAETTHPLDGDDSATIPAESTAVNPMTAAPVKVMSGHGSPGMAKAGMGDVLAGMTGALLAQGLSGFQAAQYAACWHAAAADLLATRCAETSLSASGLIRVLGEV